MHKEDSLFNEAYEKVLESWMSFLQASEDCLPPGALAFHAVQLFNTYLQCHLSPPDGTRNQVNTTVISHFCHFLSFLERFAVGKDMIGK